MASRAGDHMSVSPNAGDNSVLRTKKRWHPTASPAHDDMPKCCLFAAASSAYERHTNKVNSRVDDFTLWRLVGASTLLLNLGWRGESEASVPGWGFRHKIASLD
jgi:hypothetical protein